MAVKPIPEGYPRVLPYLVVDGAQKAIEFYVTVLGFTERMRMPGPDGRIGHAELQLGDSVVMLAGTTSWMNVATPQGDQWPPVSIHLYVEDANAAWQKAIAAGCKELAPLTDMFWGDRFGKVGDPFGHHWTIAQHIEDVSPDEMAKRGAEAMKNMPKG